MIPLPRDEILARWETRLTEWAALNVQVDGKAIAQQVIADLRELGGAYDMAPLSLTAAAEETDTRPAISVGKSRLGGSRTPAARTRPRFFGAISRGSLATCGKLPLRTCLSASESRWLLPTPTGEQAMARAKKKTPAWSYQTGERGKNRVNLYDRGDRGLYLEFRERDDAGRPSRRVRVSSSDTSTARKRRRRPTRRRSGSGPPIESNASRSPCECCLTSTNEK